MIFIAYIMDLGAITILTAITPADTLDGLGFMFGYGKG
jgi:hypothetical protein